MTISPEERAALRTEHRKGMAWTMQEVCASGDGKGWPCSTLRLLDALEAAEQQVARYRTLLNQHDAEDETALREETT